MNQTGPFNPAYGAEKFGLKDLKSISYNLDAAHLVEDAIKRGGALVAKGGVLNAETWIHTGRSPNDKFMVRDEFTEKAIWWDNNKAMTPQAFDLLYAVLAHAKGKDLYAHMRKIFMAAPDRHPLTDSVCISAFTASKLAWAAWLVGIAKPPARQVWARNFRRESKWTLS